MKTRSISPALLPSRSPWNCLSLVILTEIVFASSSVIGWRAIFISKLQLAAIANESDLIIGAYDPTRTAKEIEEGFKTGWSFFVCRVSDFGTEESM